MELPELGSMLQKHLSSGVGVNAVFPLVCWDSSGTAFISRIPCSIPLLQEKDLSSGVVHQDAAPITLPLAVFQVLVTYSGQECTGLAEQHNPPSDKVKVLQPEQSLHTCWRLQDVPEALQRSVSNSIDVPKRFVPGAGSISAGWEGAPAWFYADRVRQWGYLRLTRAWVIQGTAAFRIKGIYFLQMLL